jgi:hypothetical protein
MRENPLPKNLMQGDPRGMRPEAPDRDQAAPSRYSNPAGAHYGNKQLMRKNQRVGRWNFVFGRPGPAVSAFRAVVLAGLLSTSCAAPEPRALLKVTDVETYWVLDPSRTEKRFLAPAVRFRVENISTETLISVDATAAFLRDGTNESWGSGFFRLTEGRKRLAPGQKVLVTMSSDARYSMEGPPENAFKNATFKPVTTKFFLKVGSSPWVEFGRASVENVLGSREAREVLKQPQ